MVDTFNLLFVCAAYAAAVMWPVLLNPPDTDYYKKKRSSVPKEERPWYMLPPTVFMVVWPILYSFIIAAGILHIYLFADLVGKTFIAIIALLVINLTLNHWWSVLFFRLHRIGLALIEATFLTGTAIAITALYACTAATAANKNSWISFALFIPYTLWLMFAWVINLCWYKDGFAARAGGKLPVRVLRSFVDAQ